jgi:hypothetical protein
LQGVDVALAGGVQFGDGFQRSFGLMVVDQQLRDRHQARGFQRIVVGDAGEPAVAAHRFTHAVRGARTDQCGQAGIFRQLGCLHGGFFGVAEAPFEQGLERIAQTLVGFPLALAQAVGRHAARHVQCGAERTRHAVHQHEQQHGQNHEQVQRHVDPVRRIEQHHVAGIKARGDGNANGRGHQRD